MTNIPLPSKMHKSWHPFIQPLFNDNRFKPIIHIIKNNVNRCPSDNESIFKIFRMSLFDIRVVIVGEYPYPDNTYNTGIAFAVPKDENITHTLHVIQSELQNNYDTALQPNLTTWLTQGVFLINRVFTCEIHKPMIHKQQWKWFTEELIKIIVTERTGLHFVLWGDEARELSVLINKQFHYVYQSAHPSAEIEGKNIVTNGFYGTKVFVKINKNIRRSNGTEYEIKW